MRKWVETNAIFSDFMNSYKLTSTNDEALVNEYINEFGRDIVLNHYRPFLETMREAMHSKRQELSAYLMRENRSDGEIIALI